MYVLASNDDQWAFWISNVISLGIILNYYLLIRRSPDVLEVVIPVGGLYLITFTLRGLFLYLNADPTYVNPWVQSNLHLLGRMSSYVLAGFAGFLLAYYSPISAGVARKLPRVVSTWDLGRLGERAVRIYCVCLVARLLRIIPTGTYPFQEYVTTYLGNALGLVSTLTDVAVVLYAIYYYSRRKAGVTAGRAAFGAMVAIQLMTGLMTGYREPVVVSLMAVLFARHYVWRGLRMREVAIGVVLVVFVITPVSRAYRNLVWGKGTGTLPALTMLPGAVASEAGEQYRSGTSLLDYAAKSMANISSRFHGADSMIACMATVPRYVEFQDGKTLYLLPISVLVPRALWPEKPKIGLGTFFREKIWRGPEEESGSGGQIAITQVGELYINFGLWGVIVGMMVLGVIHRCAYECWRENFREGNYNALLFYFAALICFLGVERNLAFAYGYLCKLLILLYFLCRYLNRGPVFVRRKGRSAVPAA
jgi:hypothetical protein